MTDMWRIEYLYRDASNYKFFGELIVSGRFNFTDLERYLLDGEFFVPHSIGLTSLVPPQRNEDDHDLHAFISKKSTDTTHADIRAMDLISRIHSANKRGWFGSADPEIFEHPKVGRCLTPIVEFRAL